MIKKRKTVSADLNIWMSISERSKRTKAPHGRRTLAPGRMLEHRRRRPGCRRKVKVSRTISWRLLLDGRAGLRES